MGLNRSLALCHRLIYDHPLSVGQEYLQATNNDFYKKSVSHFVQYIYQIIETERRIYASPT